VRRAARWPQFGRRWSAEMLDAWPTIKSEEWDLRQHRLHHSCLFFYSPTPGRMAWSPLDPLLRAALTMLTVLTLFSALVLTLIILVPVRPSQENVISIPSVRRNVCDRRSRPASARGFFVHDVPLETSARAYSAHKRKRSDALPSAPRSSVDHEGPYTHGYGIRLDDALNGGPAVCGLGARDGAGRPQSCFTRRGPERKIGHTRQPVVNRSP
jgi:hypothetical protein